MAGEGEGDASEIKLSDKFNRIIWLPLKIVCHNQSSQAGSQK